MDAAYHTATPVTRLVTLASPTFSPIITTAHASAGSSLAPAHFTQARA